MSEDAIELSGGPVFVGALPSTDKHVCRCPKQTPCSARPTAEDGLCTACRAGCSEWINTRSGTHMSEVAEARS